MYSRSNVDNLLISHNFTLDSIQHIIQPLLQDKPYILNSNDSDEIQKKSLILIESSMKRIEKEYKKYKESNVEKFIEGVKKWFDLERYWKEENERFEERFEERYLFTNISCIDLNPVALTPLPIVKLKMLRQVTPWYYIKGDSYRYSPYYNDKVEVVD